MTPRLDPTRVQELAPGVRQPAYVRAGLKLAGERGLCAIDNCTCTVE